MSKKEDTQAGLEWTGHALVDVGIAGLCAHAGVEQPQELTLHHLDTAADLMEREYYSGKFGSYLSVVFMNASFVQPNEGEDKRRAFINQHLRAHRAQSDPRVAGSRCVFSGQPATSLLVRTHLPLFSGENVMNFRPEGQTGVPAAGSFVVALMFVPLAGRRAEGRMLLVHADEPWLTLAFARKYLEDNRRLLRMALPKARAAVHPEFEREQPMWDAQKGYKMADVKGPRSLVLADLTEIASQAAPTDVRPKPVALTMYLISNSGQGPSFEALDVPSSLVSFVRRAAQSRTRVEWAAVGSRFQPLRKQEDEAGGVSRGRRRRSGSADVPGRAGWSKNPAFEDLCGIFDSGFTDGGLARRWLTRYLLGRMEQRAQQLRFEATRARSWLLAALFLEEVLGMKAGRIEAVKAFGDKLAGYIERTNDKKLYRSLLFDRLHEVRLALLQAQRKSASDRLLFGLDEYAQVWLHEDGDEFLVRDLVAIRVVERLAEVGYFKEHPEEKIERLGEEPAVQQEEDGR